MFLPTASQQKLFTSTKLVYPSYFLPFASDHLPSETEQFLQMRIHKPLIVNSVMDVA